MCVCVCIYIFLLFFFLHKEIEVQGLTTNSLAKRYTVLFCVDGRAFLPFSLYLRSETKEATNLKGF